MTKDTALGGRVWSNALGNVQNLSQRTGRTVAERIGVDCFGSSFSLPISSNLTQARIVMRAFIFSIWVHVGKTSAATIAALEELAAKQYTTAEQGGRYVVSATVQGKSFTYELPDGMNGASFLETTRESWRMISIGGADSGEMTDDELKAYLLDTAGQVTDRTVAAFTQTRHGY